MFGQEVAADHLRPHGARRQFVVDDRADRLVGPQGINHRSDRCGFGFRNLGALRVGTRTHVPQQINGTPGEGLVNERECLGDAPPVVVVHERDVLALGRLEGCVAGRASSGVLLMDDTETGVTLSVGIAQGG